jgi:hypothetical protein
MAFLKFIMHNRASAMEEGASLASLISGRKYIFVRFEIPIVVTMKITVFWDVTMCSLVCRHQCFGGMNHLHLQVRCVRCMGKDHHLPFLPVPAQTSLIMNPHFLCCLLFYPEDGSSIYL